METACPTGDLGFGPSLHHNRDLTLQKYLLLQEQYDSLVLHLDHLRHGSTSSPSARSHSPPYYASSPFADSSNFTVPSRSSSLSSRGSIGSSHSPRRPSVASPVAASPLCSVTDEDTLCDLADSQAQLVGVNEGIKRALTELLNCDTTRRDAALRTWVQGRLMTAEKELRRGRRRRSGAGFE